MTIVLIVEDDFLIADMVEECLLMDGYVVCGIATNVADGLAMAIEHKPDVAIIDVRLDDGDLGTTLGRSLRQTLDKTAILYTTGNSGLMTDETIGEACLQKPYRIKALTQAISLVGQRFRAEPITEQLPENFFLLHSRL